MNASDLRRGMAISQLVMSQHLAVLRSAGLVRECPDGRFVNYEVDPVGLVRIGQWLARYRAYWPRRINISSALRVGFMSLACVATPTVPSGGYNQGGNSLQIRVSKTKQMSLNAS